MAGKGELERVIGSDGTLGVPVLHFRAEMEAAEGRTIPKIGNPDRKKARKFKEGSAIT